MTTVCFWAAAGGTAAASSAVAAIRARALRANVDMKASMRSGLLRHEAAVDDHLGSGHEGRFVGGEEQSGVRDVAGLSDPAQRDAGLELGPQRVVEVRGLQRSLDDARVDDVGADV